MLIHSPAAEQVYRLLDAGLTFGEATESAQSDTAQNVRAGKESASAAGAGGGSVLTEAAISAANAAGNAAKKKKKKKKRKAQVGGASSRSQSRYHTRS